MARQAAAVTDQDASARAALVRTGPMVAAAARQAGRRAVTGTGWLGELLEDLVLRIPVRDLAALRAQHPGRSDDEIADGIVRAAARATAAAGAAVGGLAAAQIMVPPTLLAVPLELVTETVVTAAIEMKLVAELLELYQRRPAGSATERAAAYLTAWVTQRAGRHGERAEAGMGSMLTSAGKAALRRRLTRRLAGNLTSFAPFLAGAVAGAAANRRATRTLAKRLLRDLRG